jgi:hypothetical protein
VGDDVFLGVTEDEVSEGDSFCSSRDCCESVLTRAHGEEEGADDEVGCVVILVGSEASFMRELEESTE